MPWQWPWRPRTQDRALFNIGDLVVPGTAAGEAVTVDSALRLTTVFSCVALLADSISTLPLRVYRGDDRDPIGTPPLLQRPSADFPEPSDWLWAVMASLLLRGNAWGVITGRAGAGLLPSQVDLVHPDHVTVNQSEGQPPEFRVGGQKVDRDDLWHVKAYPFPGSLLGLSPIAYARETIALGIAGEKYAARFFADSAVPSGYLHSEQRMSRDDAAMVKAVWQQAHRGRRDTAVLGAVKYQPISIAPEEAQFIETQRFNVAAICRLYRIPPGMLAGTELGGHEDYSSPEMRSVDFLQYSLRPWLHRLERAISTLLPSTQQARFNPGGLLRPTLRERYEAHKLGIDAGWLLRSEVRELEDRPPVPGIDDQPPAGGAVA